MYLSRELGLRALVVLEVAGRTSVHAVDNVDLFVQDGVT